MYTTLKLCVDSSHWPAGLFWTETFERRCSAVNRVILLRDLSEVCGICIHLTLNCTEPQCWTRILLKPILHCHAICYWYQMPCLLNSTQYANKLGQYLSWWWHVAYPVPSCHQGKCLLIKIQWDKLRIAPMNLGHKCCFFSDGSSHISAPSHYLGKCLFIIYWIQKASLRSTSVKWVKLVLVLAWRLFDGRPLPNQLFYMSLNVLVW